MSPTKRKRRRRILTDAELGAVYSAAIEGMDTYSSIIALLVLMGQRRIEVASLRTDWCNQAERLITLPDTVTKNKLEHTFPYGPLVEGILQQRSNFIEGELYFPPYRKHVRGKPTTTYAGWSKDKKAFDKRCGVSNWTLHDLRRTFATRLAEFGVLPHIVEKLLNHRLGAIKTDSVLTDVAEVYNLAKYLPETRAAIALWEQKLSDLLRLRSAA
jgi:integrase